MECEHCDDTGLDPDRYSEQPDGKGGIRYHAEPCTECQPDDDSADSVRPDEELAPE